MEPYVLDLGIKRLKTKTQPVELPKKVKVIKEKKVIEETYIPFSVRSLLDPVKK